ncbi:MAG: hypothetical protein R6U27_08270, partial [Desulfobacterales bacterium]
MKSQSKLNKTFRFMEKKSVFVVVVIMFRLVLEAGYLLYVSPVYRYAGFILDFSSIKYFESWLIFVFLIYLAPYALKKPSDFFILMLFLGLIVPLLSLYAYANESRFTVYVVLLGYLLLNYIRKGRPLVNFRIVRDGVALALGLSMGGALLVSFWFIFSEAIAYFNLDLVKVYEFRDITGDVINVGPMGYINTWAVKVFGPFLLAFGLLRKNYKLAIFAIGLHVFWFGVTAHKAVLFYPLLIVFLWFYFQRTKALSLLPVSYFILIIVVLSIYLIIDYSLPASLFLRRVFYVIARNTFDYYIFFDSEPFVYWSNSITSNFI